MSRPWAYLDIVPSQNTAHCYHKRPLHGPLWTRFSRETRFTFGQAFKPENIWRRILGTNQIAKILKSAGSGQSTGRAQIGRLITPSVPLRKT